MIEPTIKERLDILDPDYAAFIKSGFVKEIADVAGAGAGLSEDQITILSNGIVLFLLMFLDVDGFISFISSECNVDEKTASGIAGVIFGGLPDGMLDAQVETYSLLNTTDDFGSDNDTVKTLSQEDLLRR